jgi:hypothetical protein
MQPVKGVLTEDQEADGLEAFEDEEFVYIRRSGETWLVFSSRASKESIREVVDRIGVRPPRGG